MPPVCKCLIYCMYSIPSRIQYKIEYQHQPGAELRNCNWNEGSAERKRLYMRVCERVLVAHMFYYKFHIFNSIHI